MKILLAREKKIVTLLIEHEDKLTTTQIATSLKVSSRTIKADIKKINEELEKHSCRINSQQGVGLWIEYDNHEAKKYLKEVTRDTGDLYPSPWRLESIIWLLSFSYRMITHLWRFLQRSIT